jgi:hypothetical protein
MSVKPNLDELGRSVEEFPDFSSGFNDNVMGGSKIAQCVNIYRNLYLVNNFTENGEDFSADLAAD